MTMHTLRLQILQLQIEWVLLCYLLQPSYCWRYSSTQDIQRTLYSEKNMNSLNVESFLAMNIQNLDKNG